MRSCTKRVATYAHSIKNKAATRRRSPSRPAPRAGQQATPAATPAPAQEATPTAAPAAAPDELHRLKDELQRLNQEISKLARGTRRPGSEHSQLPEKQELLGQKLDLERKIRAASKP